MRFLAIAWLILGLQLSCASAGPTSAENGFKFYDKETQSLFAARLKSEGIDYRMRGDGTVLYSPKDEEKVGRIRMSVLNESFVPSAHFPDSKLEQRFTDQLNARGVRFAVQEKEGKRWITWSERDDERVKEIRDSVLDSR